MKKIITIALLCASMTGALADNSQILYGQVDTVNSIPDPALRALVRDGFRDPAPTPQQGYAQQDPAVWFAAQMQREAAREEQALRARADERLSAIGIRWMPPSGQVMYVDPGSDLYGKIYPGDRVTSIANMDPYRSAQVRANFGGQETLVEVSWTSKYGEVMHGACRRKPISNFAPWLQESLRRNAGG